MENPECEASPAPEDSSALNRNRSFKSKQLVRSQAIRESQSPPRTASPTVSVDDACADTVTVTDTSNSTGNSNAAVTVDAVVEERDEKRRAVEIHITSGSWESGEQRSRRRWPPPSRDYLSNGPRVACVAGCRQHNCRGQRRRNPCPTKQDSGISCPDECADCADFDHTGGSSNDVRKACSLDSDESYCRCPERKDKPKTNSLSRTDSADDKIEPTGPELVNFIKETLNKNQRDRMTLLMIEKELHALVTDTGRCNYKFPCMTSYGRMLVHRVATLFQLTHHLDQNSKNSVTVSKSGTSGGRIPCTSFKQWCTVNFPPSPVRHQDSVNAKSILKRDTHSPDDANASNRAVERSKSLEQREKEYERVRRRIFSTDNCSQDESQWPWLQTGPVKLLTPDSGRNKLLKVQSLEGAGPPASWRSRGAVSKSHSFGGYGGQEAPPRLLSRQGDLASSSWRLSPSSSGYKTLSLRSTDSVTPSPTGGASPEPSSDAVVFAVAELACVPPGALVIHPQTGRPLTNPDGSVYHFDPQNPPIIYDSGYQEQKIQNCEKRRGRLEKQHSFIDTEVECRCDDGRSKCCCDCRRHDACSRTNDKTPAQTEQKTSPIPSSPVKNRYEQSAEQTNQSVPLEPAANHRPAYDAASRPVVEPANQRPEIPNQIQTFESANQITAFETNQRTEFETVNQRPYESPNQRVFENRTFDASPHQRPPSFDPLPNQRASAETATNQMAPVNKLTNQESIEVPQYGPQQYSKGFRADEVTSPPQLVQNPMMGDVGVYNIMTQAKVTPVPVPDPNLRPVSLTNMMFPAPVAPAYPYINQLRMEQPLQTMYQMEEQKLAPSPHNDTFRIDPSYTFSFGCGACAGQEPHQHQRNYSLGYTQLDQVLQPHYPVGNMLPHNVQHYPYPDAMQWGGPMMPAPAKLLMPELCHVYPQYPYVYPPMIPQPYPLMQPVYPAAEPERRPRRPPSHPDPRAVPAHAAHVPHGAHVPHAAHGAHAAHAVHAPQPRDRRDSEIALKIQQIKEQMAQLNPQDKDKSGNGLLGNAPANYNGRVGRTVNDESQLSSTARAIVNSIRSMQATTYQHDTRRQMSEGYRERERRDERDDKRRPHRQMSPGNWCRRSPGPVHPVLNHPRRPHPDTRNGRR